MVGINLIENSKGWQWLVYLLLSVSINLAIGSALNTDAELAIKPPAQSLQLNLMSLEVPATPLSQPPIPTGITEPRLERVVTDTQAEETLAIIDNQEIKPEEPAEPKELVQLPQEEPAEPVIPQESPAVVQIIKEAQYRYQIPPVYPARALDLGQQGTVTLHAEVMPDGRPRQLKVAHSSGYRLLDLAALSAVKRWEFEPVSINETIIASWVSVPVQFVIGK